MVYVQKMKNRNLPRGNLIMLNYEVLRIIWWLLLGLLLIGFAIMDGFDFGVGMLLPWIGRNDDERRIVINTIGPVWEGNQVWIILGAGAIFAAWPAIYATAFSGFYLAMFLALVGFILRPVGFKYRSKIANPSWRKTFDGILFLGAFLPTLIFGVAIGNVLQGVPFYFDDTLRLFYTGTLWQLLNPFALLCGIIAICLFCMHGGLYLATKTEYPLRERAIKYSRWFALLLIVLFAVAGLWVAFGVHGYALAQPIPPDGPSNPLTKTVVTQVGAWLNNYSIHSWMILGPILGFVGASLAFLLARRGNSIMAFLSSSVAVFGVIATVGLSMFPFILPSSTNPNASLLVWDASSSQLTLFIMLIATLIFLPIIILYTTWVYRVLRGKVTADYIEKNQDNVY